MRWRVVLMVSLGWCAWAAALGQQKPAQVENPLQPQIDRAVARAVQYLRQTQAADGSWSQAPGGGSGFTLGCTALATLALMEAGVPVTDPAVDRAVQYLRRAARDTSQPGKVYELSATIWALNRFGDPDDRELIRHLTCQLIKAQQSSGLWSYDCFGISTEEAQKLIEDLKRLRLARQVYNGGQNNAGYSPGDLSNTQFAILALWIGRRYGVPTDPVLWKTAEVLRRHQNADGGWGYTLGQGVGPSTYSMTAAGLMGVSTGYGALRETLLSTTGQGGNAGANPSAPPDPTKDPVVVRANLFLARALRTPWELIAQEGYGSIPYTLWAIERVAMVYDWKSLGGMDWHSWGAMYFFRTQFANGSWDDNNRCGPIPCTAFGILFLKRSNLATDLTAHFRGEAVLRTGDDKPVAKPRQSSGQPENPANEEPPPESSQPRTASEWADRLITGSDAERRAVLEEVVRSSGGVYTLALAQAIPRTLQPNDQVEFRRALVRRMTRLSPESLRVYLGHANPELRRAAAWAVALRDEQSLASALVTLLDDRDSDVAATAYLALKALTGKDFGRDSASWKKYFSKTASPNKSR